MLMHSWLRVFVEGAVRALTQLPYGRFASRIVDCSCDVVGGSIILWMMRDHLGRNAYVIPHPLDTSKYILAARSALEGGIFDLD